MPVGLFSNYGRSYRPFRLKQTLDYHEDSWLGGAHRINVRPPIVNSLTRHLCTLSLTDTEAVALFASLDYQTTGGFNFFQSTYRLLGERDPLVQFVLHPVGQPIDYTSELQSHIPPLKLCFAGSGEDPECRSPIDLGYNEIYSDHKVGGVPYFEEIEGDVVGSLELMAEGWVHLLQLVFPGKDDDETPGLWPFGESAFHVFCRRDQSDFKFMYCWG
jgi:hypothetical protein